METGHITKGESLDILSGVSSEPQKTPLYDSHVAAGGKLVEFAGYSLPVQYSGVIAETKAVREGAGMFDVSHMARLRLTGERVIEFLEWITTNDVGSLVDGQGQYTLMTNATGGTVDDLIIYRIAEDDFGVVVNAANHEKDVAHMKAQNTFDVKIEDHTAETAMIAVQGPKAAEILKGLCSAPDLIDQAGLFGTLKAEFAGVECFAARSGYTGEDGFEIICSAEESTAVWDALIRAEVAPCGLGSRDVLRVEAGLPLYGHELNDELSPIAAGLGWVISKEKAFLGSEHVNKAREEGVPQKVQGIKLDGRRLPMPGSEIFVDGVSVGQVVSGVFSPTLGCGIAFALVSSTVKLKTPCEVDMRGKREPGTVVSKRFLKRS